ncbi:MAG TPA: nicotinate phosphoribosyltransferase [Candidatus Baltobacteraceae bacterium]|nr:nicotinate phosphoribosyltransferase [Candidatus Baltobacteraceae bacterium]
MNNYNLILDTDSYKYSHYAQLPSGTTHISSYIESRGGDFPFARFFGLQGLIKQHFLRPVTVEQVEEGASIATQHGLPYNHAGWMRIVEKHHGLLPVQIEAVPEGVDVPAGNVLAQIVNTDPEFAWLPAFIETSLLRLWYPTTVCTLSATAKRSIMEQLDRSCDDPAAVIPFRLHDFGARGVSSYESAAIGGLAHLVNFLGTDTVAALTYAAQYYHEPMAGYSIPAMEHSTVTAWGRDGEARAFENMIDHFAQPGKVFAIVADSYDIDYAVEEIIGRQLREKIVNSGATLVVRPDSGDPKDVVPRVLASLARNFGATKNQKGYLVLAPSVRVIQGDGMELSTIASTGEAILKAGFSAENCAYGMGGGLLQKVNRDTMKFAMKVSAAMINGQWIDVFKSPKGDMSKRSKAGRLALTSDLQTVRLEELGARENLLRPVLRNGELLIDQSLTTIRERAAQSDASCMFASA